MVSLGSVDCQEMEGMGATEGMVEYAGTFSERLSGNEVSLNSMSLSWLVRRRLAMSSAGTSFSSSRASDCCVAPTLVSRISCSAMSMRGSVRAATSLGRVR